MADPTCPRCGGEMEAGFLVDHTYGTAAASEWVEGPVEAVCHLAGNATPPHRGSTGGGPRPTSTTLPQRGSW